MRTLTGILVSMRPKQWTKNFLVFAALIFSASFNNPVMIMRSFLAFALFCLVSGAIYLFNDLNDIESDRHHEKKRNRPLASGQLSPGAAIAAMIVIALVSIAGSWFLGTTFLVIVIAYFIIQLLYTLVVKNVEILDVMAIAAGFLLRAIAGVAAINTTMSYWLIICTGLLALFLALGKRRHELLLLEDKAYSHRASLHGYSPELIDQLISVVTSLTIMSYTLYTFFPIGDAKHERLLLTVPFVIYGIFRYLKLIYMHQLGGDPEEILLSDRPLIVAILAFVVCAGLALYIPA
jgi:4-hydroxybenzoate polyprenyltransferase